MATKKEKKKPGGTAPVYTQILVRPLHRGVNDVGSWRSAIRMADIGVRSKLYNLYEDLLIDGYLSDAIDKRIDAVTDCDLSFTIKNKETEAVTELMDTPEFELLLREIMLSRFWGISVDETFFLDGFNFKSIPRKHIRPKYKEIAINEEDERGIPYEGNDMILQFGGDDDYGIILKAAPYVIYKRGGFGDWAQFVELFGMPQRIGKYSSMDDASRRALIEAFETAGSAPYLVIPKETEAIQTSNSGTGNGSLYNDFRKACNEEILITILGQTMTTQDGSSLSQSKVHLEVQEKKHRADRRYVERMLNKLFLPLLEKRGYPVTGGKFRFLDKAQEITVDETVQLVKILPIPQSYLYEKYNIPQPKGSEAIAGEIKEPEKDPGKEPTKEPGKDPAKPDKEKDVKNDDRNFLIRLFDFFVSARQDRATGEARIKLNDDSLDSRLINRISLESPEFDAELFRLFADDFLNAVSTGFKKPVKLADTFFTYGAADDAFLTAMEMNIFHFSAAKTLAELQELNRLFRESKSFEDFYKKASDTLDVFNKRWQKTEYETAVLTAEAASTYQRLIQKTDLFPYWEYKTVGDDQVRPEHRKLEGVILPANDPLWDKIFPPNGWKCRCGVAPRMRHEVAGVDFDEMRARVKEYFGTKEWKQNEAQGWGSNRAKEATVFTEDQMYIRKFPNQAAKYLEKVSPPDWGINKSVSTLMKEAEAELPVYNGIPETWWNINKTVVNDMDVIEFKDYNSRVVYLEKADFNKNESTSYLDVLKNIVSNPAEVWLNKGDKSLLDNIVMIRYYKDVAVAVIAKVNNGSAIVIKSWMKLNKDLRKGILIKKTGQ